MGSRRTRLARGRGELLSDASARSAPKGGVLAEPHTKPTATFQFTLLKAATLEPVSVGEAQAGSSLPSRHLSGLQKPPTGSWVCCRAFAPQRSFCFFFSAPAKKEVAGKAEHNATRTTKSPDADAPTLYSDALLSRSAISRLGIAAAAPAHGAKTRRGPQGPRLVFATSRRTLK